LVRHLIRLRGNTRRETAHAARQRSAEEDDRDREERMSKLASQLLQNETLMGALQKTMSARWKRRRRRSARPSRRWGDEHPDLRRREEARGKIEELEKVFEGLSAKIAELQQKKDAQAQQQQTQTH